MFSDELHYKSFMSFSRPVQTDEEYGTAITSHPSFSYAVNRVREDLRDVRVKPIPTSQLDDVIYNPVSAAGFGCWIWQPRPQTTPRPDRTLLELYSTKNATAPTTDSFPIKLSPEANSHCELIPKFDTCGVEPFIISSLRVRSLNP